MSPAYRDFIKFLARIAVEEYLHEIRNPEKLLSYGQKNLPAEQKTASPNPESSTK